MAALNKKTLQTLKEKLQQDKVSLEKELNTFATEDKKPGGDWDAKFPKFNGGDRDLEEEADEVQEYDNKLSLEYSLELKLKDVNVALEKMEKGTYGICEKCGKKITEERLLACPEAKTCLNCHKK